MSKKTTYETIDTSIGETRNYSRGNARLGKKDSSTLKEAFKSPINNAEYTKEIAAAEFGSYNGENASYGLEMYRRNFIPDPLAGDIYKDPRNVLDVRTTEAGDPSSPFTPTVGSPGEGYGVTPTGAPVSAPRSSMAGTDEQENPATYSNNTADGTVSGKVRTFTLGYGSNFVRNRSNP